MTKRHNIKSLLDAQKRGIERVVCSGGGAKGVVYPGAYKALIDTGLLQNIRVLSGASAGALVATLMALGMESHTFRKHLLTTSLKELLGDTIGHLFEKNTPGITFLTKDGKPLEQFMRNNIITTIRTTLNTLKNTDKTAQDSALKELFVRIFSDNPKITFADLAILNNHFPQHFKQLVITAVRFPTGKLHVFNSELTPDVEIALACRASASIPILFAPVAIEINGVVHHYVDGGFYDNLPTDYFDRDANEHFAPNLKPEQTLVFAFGEGLDNKKNQIFQALYGSRWDETIEDALIHNIFEQAMKQSKILFEPEEDSKVLKNQISQLNYALKQTIVTMQRNAILDNVTAKKIMDTMHKAMTSLSQKTKESAKFWDAYQQEKQTDAQINLLGQFAKEKMKPLLYKAGIIQQLRRNLFINMFSGLTVPYNNIEEKEKGYQKLRTHYALRTVELRVGDIKTTDFDKANKLARIMDALGYLDTINHITNHELHKPDMFSTAKFFPTLVANFEHIYTAVLLASGHNPHKEPLFIEINQLKNQLINTDPEAISRQIVQLIKERVEQKPESRVAFALSRAVEFYNKNLTAEELFKETYEEGFKRSALFSRSTLTKKSIYRSTTLHQSLQKQNMFALYNNQTTHSEETRTDKVFHALQKIGGFSHAFDCWSKNTPSVP